MHIIIGILAAIVIFAILVIVHEGGHFMAAKAVGVKVNEFSVGMGPLLLKKQKGDTQYSIRAVPIGGYVAMEGESEDSEDERAFNRKPAWAKALVIAAGPFMNFVLAVLVLGALITWYGTSVTPYIGEVGPDTPAYEAGLREGDRILKVNGKEVDTGEAIAEAISSAAESADSVDITYRSSHASEPVTSTVSFREEEDGHKRIGIQFRRGHNVLTGMKYGLIRSVELEKEMLSVLGKMITGKGSTEDVVGPVGIVNVVDQTAQTGFANLLLLLAILSLNLGLVNILPFPALDGGRLLFILIRAVTGKAITDSMENAVHYFGLILLLALMLLITMKDINTFFIK